MGHTRFLAIFTVVILLAISFQESSAIHCWTCSSFMSNGAYCLDPFDASIIPDESKRWLYAECDKPTLGEKPACRKIIDRVDGRLLIRRGCVLVNSNETKDACMNEQVSRHIQREFCETCHEDGCNGASLYGPAALFVFVSATITKWLSS